MCVTSARIAKISARTSFPRLWRERAWTWLRAVLIGVLAFGLLGSVFWGVGELVRRLDRLEAANRAMYEPMYAQWVQRDRVLRNAQPVVGCSCAEPIRHNRLAWAVLQLRIALPTHLPFGSELALVRQLSREEEGLSVVLGTLDPHAAVGVATLSELRDSFGILLLPKLQPLLEGTGSGWFSWMVSAVAPSPWIVKSNQRRALVVTALDRLTADDLRGAVDQLTQLDGSAADLVVHWLQEAKARLAVDSADHDLSGMVVELLGHAP